MMHFPLPAVVIACLVCALCACGGGGGGGGGASPGADGTAAAAGASSSAAPVTPTILPTVSALAVQVAQTHVLPATGLNWTLPNATGQLHLVGGRDALVLVRLGTAGLLNPVLTAWQAGVSLGSVALQPPSALPPTEDGGPALGTDLWSATLPAAWVLPGVAVQVGASNAWPSPAQALSVGADMPFELRVLPYYLFGASDATTGTRYADVKAPSAAVQQELVAKWPVASLQAATHSVGRVDLNHLVVAPRSNAAGVPQPAYVLTSMEQQRDGYAAMDSVLRLLRQLREANGEAATNNQYYAPILSLKNVATTPVRASLGGGLGGSGGGVGTEDYSGIFIHEQGHAFGLPHAAGAYDAGSYPYPGGSLLGSAWGYDTARREFLSPYVPRTASAYAGCLSSTSRQAPVNGRCIKQDPMQSGAGDQSSAYRFATFSDYNTGQMQTWLEGTTTVDAKGVRQTSGGVVVADAAQASGYKRWDSLARQWLAFVPTTLQGGLYGVKQNFPQQRNVPVHAIALTLSRAGTAGITQVYPPLSHVGHLLTDFDPSSAADRAAFTVDTAPVYYWYCKGTGCDYTVRITYADGSVIHRLLRGGFRPWFKPRDEPAATTLDPLSSDSFKSWTLQVPAYRGGAAVALSKVELLYTPLAWTFDGSTPGTTLANAAVLARWVGP
jgi:Peptidase M66